MKTRLIVHRKLKIEVQSKKINQIFKFILRIVKNFFAINKKNLIFSKYSDHFRNDIHVWSELALSGIWKVYLCTCRHRTNSWTIKLHFVSISFKWKYMMVFMSYISFSEWDVKKLYSWKSEFGMNKKVMKYYTLVRA